MAKNNPKPLPPLAPKDIKRFWSKIDKSPCYGPKGDCWIWTGARQTEGYGRFGLRPVGHVKASRVAYYLGTGTDPFPLLVLHRCDYPPCCNPAHLFLGDDLANSRDCFEKGRGNRATGDSHWQHHHPELRRFGATHPNTKLTDDAIRDIRAFGASERPRLAEKYGITIRNVRAIQGFESWKHIH